MEIEIWSGVVCPWRYIGKRRFEKALERFPHRDAVTIHWRSFELDPHAAQQFPGTLNDMLAQKYNVTPEVAGVMNARVSGLAAAEGLDYHLDAAQPGNTFDAHRLLHLAAKRGVQGTMKECLLRAYFTESRPIGDTETLAQLAAEAGLDVDEARATLASDNYADEVRADEERAALLGIHGVPFLVVDAALWRLWRAADGGLSPGAPCGLERRPASHDGRSGCGQRRGRHRRLRRRFLRDLIPVSSRLLSFGIPSSPMSGRLNMPGLLHERRTV